MKVIIYRDKETKKSVRDGGDDYELLKRAERPMRTSLRSWRGSTVVKTALKPLKSWSLTRLRSITGRGN